jgi:NSS family neurotransmitter:Na+ symporter
MENKQRSRFGSNFGFMMACIGGAVGLGNVWGFPGKLGRGGGFWFLLIYIVIVFLMGIPMTITEYSLGRKTRKGPVAAYQELCKKFTWIGVLNTIVCTGVMCFYWLLMGWILRYAVGFFLAIFNPASTFWTTDSSEFFGSFIANPIESLAYTFVCVIISYLILRKDAAKGIEKICKWMIPALVVLLIVVAVRACTLPGASEGLAYMFKPNGENFNAAGGFFAVLALATAQMFFSVNVGFGTNLLYGSYIPEESNMSRSSIVVPIADMIVAILAGLATIPAAFAFGYSPSTGAGMLFVTMKAVFATLPGGALFGFIFMIAVFFAGISSATGVTAAIMAVPEENWKWSHKKATVLSHLIPALITIPICLGYSAFSGVAPLSWLPESLPAHAYDLLDSLDYICENVLAVVAALGLVIYAGWIYKPQNVIAEVERNGVTMGWKKLYTVLIKFVCPVIVAFVVLTSIGILQF